MAKKFKRIKAYQYECTITGEKFTTTREAPHPNELVSVKAFYQLHPDEDDRPEFVKKALEEETSTAAVDSPEENKDAPATDKK